MSVPQIRIAAIEAIARKILMEYDPALLEGEPCAIPIETIIETKFDLILEYHTLRKNGSILGETIFDDGAVILYDQYQHEYRLIGVKAGTILIDERLCEPQRLGRLRFTCGHELAHWVLHKKLYTGTGDVAAYDGNSSTDESTLTSSDTNHQVCSASGVITPLHQRYIARQIAALNRPLYFCCERSLCCLALYQAVIHQLVSGHGMMKRSALL